MAGDPDRLGEEGLHRLIAEHVVRFPEWRRDPQALLRRLIARAEELNGEALTDDVAMLLVGSRDVVSDRA